MMALPFSVANSIANQLCAALASPLCVTSQLDLVGLAREFFLKEGKLNRETENRSVPALSCLPPVGWLGLRLYDP